MKKYIVVEYLSSMKVYNSIKLATDSKEDAENFADIMNRNESKKYVVFSTSDEVNK